VVQPMENVVVKTVNSVPIRVRDISSVEDSYQEETELIRINGKPGLTLAVQKLADANTVNVVDNVKREIPNLPGIPPNVHIALTADQSLYIRQTISGLGREGLLGGLLAMLIILVFLRNLRGTTIVLVAIPLAILITFIMFRFGNVTLNIMTFGGLALAVGRLVDAGKQVSLLTQHEHPVPVCIVGAEQTVAMPRIPIRADVKVAVAETSVAICGPQTEAQLRALYSRSSIYAATARYDPLGMQALEAAFSRCAIVANDIPSFREVWGDAALYFHANDAASLAASIRRLNDDRTMRRAYAELAYTRARERFTSKRMIDNYIQLYRGLVSIHSAAA